MQGLGLRASEEELVDETAAGVEAQTAVRGRKPTCQSLLFCCCGRQGKTCLLAPVKSCWSATLARGLEGASMVCGGWERDWDRVSLLACYGMFLRPWEELCLPKRGVEWDDY
jgi:hypothetical protein